MESPKNKIKVRRQIQGFTIVELLIASGIALIILAIVGFMYVSSERSFKFGQTVLNSEADLRLAMDWLVRDIRAAKSISPDTVTLTIPPDTVTLTISLESGDTVVDYTFDSGKNQLMRTVEGESRPIAPVSVSIDPPSGYTVTITLHPATGDTTRTLTSKITMRNAQ